MRRMTLAGGLALAVSACMLIAAPVAAATTYNNDTPITIPAQGIADPYPSSITVTGMAGPITDVNVGFDGIVHTNPGDMAIVLVAPSGQALDLLDCVGGSTDAVGAFVTLDDAAAADLPDNGALVTGTFRPTSHCATTRSFPAPGPLTTYENPGPNQGGTATFASAFNGTSAIGTWNLYVFDAITNNSGSVPGGWSLDVAPDVTPLPDAMQTQTQTQTQAQTPPPTKKKKCKKKKAKGKKGVAAAKKCKKKKKKK